MKSKPGLFYILYLNIMKQLNPETDIFLYWLELQKKKMENTMPNPIDAFFYCDTNYNRFYF
jgi:hypothetical protein